MRKSWLCGAAAAFSMTAAPASAQMAVVDHSNLAQTIATVRNTLRMIDQGTEQLQKADALFQSMNKVTDISSVGQILNSDLVRRGLPSDVTDSINLASSDLSELGSIGRRAKQLLEAHNLQDALTGPDAALGSSARAAARDAALAETSLAASAKTTEGIDQLKQRLATSASAKETADLQARGVLEVAQLLNLSNQRQALEQAKLASERLAMMQRNAKRDAENDAAIQERRILPTLNKN